MVFIMLKLDLVIFTSRIRIKDTMFLWKKEKNHCYLYLGSLSILTIFHMSYRVCLAETIHGSIIYYLMT
jgi:hypothetical protein